MQASEKAISKFRWSTFTAKKVVMEKPELAIDVFLAAECLNNLKDDHGKSLVWHQLQHIPFQQPKFKSIACQS